MKATLLGVAAMASLAACATTALVGTALVPLQLNGSPKSFDGKEVTVYGYMQFEPHARGLWQDKAALAAANLDGCVSLLVPRGADFSGFHGSYVVLKGRFLNNPGVVNIHACNFTHLELHGGPQLAPRPRPGSRPNSSSKPTPLRGAA